MSQRKWLATVALTACLALGGAAAATADDEDDRRLREVWAKRADPKPPPAALPAHDPSVPPPRLAYVYGGYTFLLGESTFHFLLFDTPKAHLFRVPAKWIAADARFYYFADTLFNREWAFGKEPPDSFANHAIWSRTKGSTDWQLQSAEAVMAELRPQSGKPADKPAGRQP